MGKDQSGNFHPGKGKPSGINKEEGLGIQATPPEKMDAYLEATEKYTTGADELAPSVPVRHPNRNTSKGEDTFKGKQNKQESDKTKEQAFSEEEITTTPVEQLPGILTKERFAELANYRSECCISLYVPSHPAGVEVNEHFDPIHVKNKLQQLTAQLKQTGMDEGAVKRLLQPGFDLLRDDSFWLNLSPGLGFFIADGFFKYIKLPFAPLEEMIVEPTFYVTPLIPVMQSKEYFYLLVISKHTAKLFKADAFGMQPVPIELPQGIDEVKRLSEKDASTWRTGSRGGTGGANFHGIGGGNPDEKTNIAVYFEAVDDILFKEIFNKENAPLLLAGVEYEIPIYKSVCDYHNVWEKALTGSREHQDATSLYREALEVMQPYFEERLNKALTAYGNQSATALTTSIVSDIIPAAYYSQIAQLFVAKGEHIWGTFDEMNNQLTLQDNAGQDVEDLLDTAVVKTLANGGEVFLLDREKMPAGSPVAALLRYA